ncbi:MAG: fused MFS/spermidine synthase [Dehalococcoidia bacterium]|nr:fused MFS/spermidine synthase [Dehalococcoidia bacterium]
MRTSLWKANFIVFMSSTCVLVIELVAGRLMAPYVGVSLYTWTSIIGVVLAGISLGNFAGGRLADRRASPGVLGLLFFLGGLSTLGILVATTAVQSMPLAYSFGPLAISVSLIAKIVLFTTVIFFLPCFILGMVSPVVVKLTLKDLGQAGNVVGMIYAFGAAGSIVGTFLTGFLLISSLGTRSIIWIVALVLIILGVVFGEYWKVWHKQRASVVGLMILAYGIPFGTVRDDFKAPCLVESNYYCIYVYQTQVDGKQVEALVLDHLIHSYNSLDDPTSLGYGYERIYAEVTAYLSQSKQGLRAAFIGGGGYTYPRYMEAVYPDSAIDVAEIDPAVTQMAYDRLGLSADTRIRTYNQDARLFISVPHEAYDLFFGDAFNDLSVPYHLTTREFVTLVKGQLKDDGIYMANIIDKYKDGQFLGAFMKTVKEVFPYVYLMGPGPAWDYSGPSTFVVMASLRPFDLEAFKAYAGRIQTSFTAVMDQSRLDSYLSDGQWITLTDDYAPVDNLVAPLFVERGY